MVATPPFYLAPSEDEILEHYRLVAAASPVPVLAYSIPAATHVPVPPSVVRAFRAGDPPPVPATAGRRALQLADAAIRSHETGARVVVAEP